MKAKNKKTFTGEMKRLDLSWSNLARLTAKILSHLPNRPLPTHSSGLLDISGPTPIENPEWEFPMLDRSLNQLQSVATFIEGYARTTEFPLDKSEGQALVTALAQLDFIRESRYVPPDIKRDLPINIAAIVRTASTANALKAAQPRSRENELMSAKFEAMARNPGLKWKELLTTLQGDEIVLAWDPATVQWIDVSGNRRETSSGTFRNWKPKK